jgi:hypothetical protein
MPLSGGNYPLTLIEHHFHELIRRRAGNLVKEARLELPRIDTAAKREENAAWFPIPGMYGGFKYWIEEDSRTLTLICESWSRVGDGSGQRHRIDAEGAHLVDEGFV